MLTHSADKSTLNSGFRGYTRWGDWFLGPFALKTREGSNQGLFTAKPRHGHSVCTLQVHPPTSLLSHPFCSPRTYLPRTLMDMILGSWKSNDAYMYHWLVKGSDWHCPSRQLRTCICWAAWLQAGSLRSGAWSYFRWSGRIFAKSAGLIHI